MPCQTLYKTINMLRRYILSCLCCLVFANNSNAVPETEDVGPYYRGQTSIIANIWGDSNRQYYVKLDLIIKVKEHELNKPKLNEMWPEIVHETIFLLDNYTADALMKQETKLKVKEDLKALITQLFKTNYEQQDVIEDVLFGDFVLQ